MAAPAVDVVAKELGKFNGFMQTRSFISGTALSQDDVKYFAAFPEVPGDKFVHAQRWWNHVAAFSAAERAAFPAASSGTAAPAAAAPKAAAKAAPAEDDDDDWGDDDMFGDDDDDDGSAAAAAAEAKKKMLAAKAVVDARAAKKIENGKSLIVFEIKPFDAETDLEELAQKIKALGDLDGRIQNWGQQHKLEPVAYGICKLVLSCVVYDMKIGVDDITDIFEDKFGDDIQSVDMQSMSKC